MSAVRTYKTKRCERWSSEHCMRTHSTDWLSWEIVALPRGIDKLRKTMGTRSSHRQCHALQLDQSSEMDDSSE